MIYHITYNHFGDRGGGVGDTFLADIFSKGGGGGARCGWVREVGLGRGYLGSR